MLGNDILNLIYLLSSIDPSNLIFLTIVHSSAKRFLVSASLSNNAPVCVKDASDWHADLGDEQSCLDWSFTDFWWGYLMTV